MASGFGHDGVGRCDGKRKRSDDQEYAGDPPTAQDSAFLGVMADTSFYGVRVRVVVEIRNWAGKGHDDKSRDFNMDVKTLKDVGMLKDVEMQKVVAAIIHDLARLYRNPHHPVKSLNIHRVELFIRKQDLEEALCIGKGLLDKYVRDNPLTWVNRVVSNKEFTDLKKDIAERALPFLKILKDAITKELSQAGRQRQDEDQLFPAVEGVDVLEEAEKEIQHLKNRVASLEETLTSKDAIITSLWNQILGTANTDPSSPILGPEVFFQDIQHLSDQMSDLEVTHAAKLKAKDVELVAKGAELKAKDAELVAKGEELKAKDDRIASLEKLLTAQRGYFSHLLRPASSSSLQQLLHEFLQDDD